MYMNIYMYIYTYINIHDNYMYIPDHFFANADMSSPVERSISPRPRRLVLYTFVFVCVCIHVCMCEGERKYVRVWMNPPRLWRFISHEFRFVFVYVCAGMSVCVCVHVWMCVCVHESPLARGVLYWCTSRFSTISTSLVLYGIFGGETTFEKALNPGVQYCIHIYMCVCVRECVCACVCVRVRVYLHGLISPRPKRFVLCMFIFVCECVCVRVHVCVCVRVWVCVCMGRSPLARGVFQ